MVNLSASEARSGLPEMMARGCSHSGGGRMAWSQCLLRISELQDAALERTGKGSPC
jgi:hypothetical protein